MDAICAGSTRYWLATWASRSPGATGTMLPSTGGRVTDWPVIRLSALTRWLTWMIVSTKRPKRSPMVAMVSPGATT